MVLKHGCVMMYFTVFYGHGLAVFHCEVYRHILQRWVYWKDFDSLKAQIRCYQNPTTHG